ncbi:MAG: stage V sporulation protein S [Candidatus Eremiobacteraeota bacterium]|nr:stage V sporulation protein S [Candidatus Eremiobacteraeota bacterium]
MIEPPRTASPAVLKVSAQSNPNSVAGALAGVLRERPQAELQAIGAGATNQAVKAIAIARSYLQPTGIDLVCVPEFTDVEIEGQVRTAIRLLVERRAVSADPDAER